jgi:hypothetical protein
MVHGRSPFIGISARANTKNLRYLQTLPKSLGLYLSLIFRCVIIYIFWSLRPSVRQSQSVSPSVCSRLTFYWKELRSCIYLKNFAFFPRKLWAIYLLLLLFANFFWNFYFDIFLRLFFTLNYSELNCEEYSWILVKFCFLREVGEVSQVVDLKGSAGYKLKALTENRILIGSLGFWSDRDRELESRFTNNSIM